MSSLLKLLSVLGITIFACSQTMAAGYSSRTHNYAIEYLKPKAGMGDISIINITVNRKITASEAERLLKEEIQRATTLLIGKSLRAKPSVYSKKKFKEPLLYFHPKAS